MAADNSSALASLRRQIDALRALSVGPKVLAPAVANAVRARLVAQIAAGQFPSGAAWPETQDGRVALRNAAGALSVRAIGSAIVATLSGVEARHSVGAVRGHIQRQILPSAAGQLRAIGEAVAGALAAEMKRRGF